MSNIKDVDLLRRALDTPPFLLIVCLTPLVESVVVYVLSLGQSRDNTPIKTCVDIPLQPTRGAMVHESNPPALAAKLDKFANTRVY